MTSFDLNTVCLSCLREGYGAIVRIYAGRTNLVLLAPDVAVVFSGASAVNEALGLNLSPFPDCHQDTGHTNHMQLGRGVFSTLDILSIAMVHYYPI